MRVSIWCISILPSAPAWKAHSDGLVVQIKPGAVPQYKKYLSSSAGRSISNLWVDIECVADADYPTQKPVELLKRIISACSNEGDLVLDPFAGSGTTWRAAYLLGRRFTGIEISEETANLARFLSVVPK